MFLKEVANDLYQKFGNRIGELALVFPNKRPAVYIRHHLGSLIEGPTWSPHLFTIHEFIGLSSTRLPADRLLQSFLLFEAYSETLEAAGEEYTSNFEKFYALGEILLNDFTELEANLAPIVDVYANLKQLGEIERGFDYLTEEQQAYLQRFWSSFSTDKLSKQQEKFIRLWNHLPAIYQSFARKLHQKSLVNTGTIYRELVTNKNDRPGFLDGFSKIVFIGFNALNRAELQLFSRWQEEGKALFYFDADIHYCNDELQEAGLFMRRNLSLFKNQLETGNGIRRTDRPIHLVHAEGDAAQVRLIPQLLNEIPELKSAPERVAILLADEKQLLPVLHALPGDIPVNVTMGYKLQLSPVFSLIRALLDIQLSYQQHNAEKLYYHPLLQFLQHPWLQQYQPAVSLAKQVMETGMVIIYKEEINLLSDEQLKTWLQPVNSMSAIFELLRRLVSWWAAGSNRNNLTELHQQLATSAYLQLNRLEGLLANYQPGLNIPFVAETIIKVLSTLSAPLEGEPLKGLQVMGLLESRGLDFDRIILLNANEGVLPKRAAAPTFLPESIRRAFGLSVLENQDSIFAYVFYRLLQRSSELWCTYNSTVTDQSTGEKSRFLTQLEHETEIPTDELTLLLPVSPQPKPPIRIQKSEQILKTLAKYSGSILSPSAINGYIDCRLRFYFRYIAGIKEPDRFQDEIDPRTLGLILHKTMEFLYTRLEQHKGNKSVTRDDISKMRQWLKESELDRAFALEIRKDVNKTIQYNGTALIIREVILSYAETILQADEQYAPFNMVFMEKQVEARLPVEYNGRTTEILIGGYIDRIDEKDGVYRIIDYKTGKDDRAFPSVESFFDRAKKDRNKAALQTIIYAWVLQQSLGHNMAIETGLYDIRNMKKEKQKFNWRFIQKESRGEPHPISHLTHHGIEQATLEGLVKVVQEIFDANTDFDQTTIIEKCSACPYNILCGR